jgi:hypothetical protein
MNGLFRVAFRALCWSSIVAFSVALVVSINGITPEALVAFQTESKPGQHPTSKSQSTAARDEPLLTEYYARAQTSSRLDVPESNGPAVSPAFKSNATIRQRTIPQPPVFDESDENSVARSSRLSTQKDTSQEVDDDTQIPEITDFEQPAELQPESNVEAHTQARPKSNTESIESRLRRRWIANRADALNLPPHPDELNLPEDNASSGPDQPTQTPPQAVVPVIEPTPVKSAPAAVPARTIPDTGMGSLELPFLERMSQMQRQLDQISSAQQQDRRAAQSQFETTQMYQQRKLEEKLEGIEKGLRDMRSERMQAAVAAPVPMPVSPATGVAADREAQTESSTAASTAVAVPPLVREEKPGPDGQKRYSVNSQRGGDLRELLDALAQKANFNLVLAINVEGDVELSLQSVTADEALDAIKKTTGYIVEKSGRKVYVGQPGTHLHQRQEFLPPIIK